MYEITCIPSEEYTLDNSKLMYVLNLLSCATKEDKNTFLLPREVNFYLKHSLCIVFALSNNDLMGAASVISCLDNRTNEKMWIGSKLVVELGSNYVDPNYRGKGLAKEFVNTRLNFCKTKNHFAVSVTSNSTMKKIFDEIGGTQMDKYPEYVDLCSRIRTCNCPKNQKLHDLDCKMLDKEVWMFDNLFY